jgi:son of sevenless-like protein
MHELSDHSRNSAKYRQRLRNTVAPAVPFLGLILTDVTFTREGNGSHRPSPIDPAKMLINFNRYNRLAKIMGGKQFIFYGVLNLIQL